VINGDTSINGGTVQVGLLGTLVGTHDYEILKAQAVAGAFDVSDPALVEFWVSESSLSYDANSVWLHLVAMRFDDPSLAQTHNQRQVAAALQDIADGGGTNIIDALQDLESPDDVRHAYDQLSGRSRPALAPLTISGTSRLLANVSGRMETLQTGLMSGVSDVGLFAMSGPDSGIGRGWMYETAGPGQSIAVGNGSGLLADRPWGVWGRGYGLFGDRTTEGDVLGYTYQMYGASLGLDYRLTDKFLAGIVLGMSEGTVDFTGTRDNANLRTMNASLYGSYASGPWFLSSVASYVSLDYDTERFVDLTGERLVGNPGGYELAAYVEAGRNWELAPNLLLQPLASLQYAYLNLDSYTETGGISALAFDDESYQSVKGSMGARLTRRLLESAAGFRLDGQLRGRWVHEFGDNQSSVDTWFVSNAASVFTIRDAEISRDSALLGAGLSADLSSQLRAYADYNARVSSDETVQVISAALQYRW
jgi:outer membrane autotransporter protein